MNQVGVVRRARQEFMFSIGGGLVLAVLGIYLYQTDSDPAFLFENPLIMILLIALGVGLALWGWTRYKKALPRQE